MQAAAYEGTTRVNNQEENGALSLSGHGSFFATFFCLHAEAINFSPSGGRTGVISSLTALFPRVRSSLELQ